MLQLFNVDSYSMYFGTNEEAMQIVKQITYSKIDEERNLIEVHGGAFIWKSEKKKF